jgi:hypothetical protein
MTISSVLNQIFRPAAHQLKLDHRVASNVADATKSIRALLNRISNHDFNVDCSSGAHDATKNLHAFRRVETISLTDATQIRSEARVIRQDMHMQLKEARKLVGGVESWNKDRVREMQKIEKMADRLVHFKPGKA